MNYPAKVKMQCLVFPPTGINKRTAACSDLHYLIRPPTLVMNHSHSLSLSHGLVSALNFSSDFRCPVPPWPLWHFCLAMDLTWSHSFWHTLCLSSFVVALWPAASGCWLELQFWQSLFISSSQSLECSRRERANSLYTILFTNDWSLECGKCSEFGDRIEWRNSRLLGGMSFSGQFFFKAKEDTSLNWKGGVQVELPVEVPIIGSKAAYLTRTPLSVPSSGYHQKPYPPQGESNLTPFPT